MPATQPQLSNVWARSIRPFLGRCRSKLRHLKFVTHDYLHRKIFGCSLWNEEMKHLIRTKAYQETSPPPAVKSRLIVYMTEGTEFAGLADRLRTMGSAYIIAAENNRNLYIYHQSGDQCILLCSDSNRFLQAPHPDYVKILPGEVGHIIKNNGNDAKTDKAFTDLFVMSKASCLYRITGKHIYTGGFARTAADIGGKQLIDLRYTRFI